MPEILAEAKELIDNVIMNGDVQDAEALLRLAETLSKTPGEHSEMALQAAFTASNNLESDSDSYKAAIALWRQSFNALGDDSQKMAALEAMQGSVFADTDWEQIYNEAWGSLPDSPAKRAAAKTPEFYDELRARFAEYGVRNVDRKLAEIEKLRFDTRSWSDFVSKALAEDQIFGTLGNILERDLQPPQNRGDASVSQPADSQGPQQQNPQQQQQRRPEPSAEQIALQQRGLKEARRRADAAIQNARRLGGSAGSNSLVQDVAGSHQTPSMAGRVTTVSNIESPEFYDVGRIIDPESPIGVDFAERMQTLAERLAGNRYDPTRHRARYFLADEKTVNAYTIPSSNPPIIVIHRGLLENVKSLDELAGVLAHEWGHIFAHQELGNHSVGKSEEGAADLIAVRLLAEAGFDASALENLLVRMNANEKTEKPETLLETIFRVHPLTDNRASAMEKARILLNRSGYNSDNIPTPLPEALLNLARQADYKSTTDIPARLAALDYDGKSIPEQLEILVSLAEKNAQIDKRSNADLGRHFYEEQIADAFKKISVADATEATQEIYQTAFSKILKVGLWDQEDSLQSFYKAALTGLGKKAEEPWEAIGDFRRLKETIHSFLSAKSADEAIASGETFVAEYHEHDRAVLFRTYDKDKPFSHRIDFGDNY